ncbi:MAG: hypothetical protein AB7H88_05350 [Vicinamibacterales bacterium]
MSFEASDKAPGVSAGRPSPSDEEVFARAERVLTFLRGAAIELWRFLRFIPFLFFIVFLVLSFWLGVLTAAMAVVRFLLRLVGVTLLWLSGGAAPRRGGKAPSFRAGVAREWRLLKGHSRLAWEEFVRPIRRHATGVRYAGRMFWHWHVGRKLFAVAGVVAFIVLPFVYLIPRPYDVQVTDDNALVNTSSEDDSGISYLVHTVDLDERGKTREFENIDMWWLGKVNSQGLKSQVQTGHLYRLWVVGIRWYKFPTLYPNIIKAQEITADGRRVDDPSRLMAIPSTPVNFTGVAPAPPLAPDNPVMPVQQFPATPAVPTDPESTPDTAGNGTTPPSLPGPPAGQR